MLDLLAEPGELNEMTSAALARVAIAISLFALSLATACGTSSTGGQQGAGGDAGGAADSIAAGGSSGTAGASSGGLGGSSSGTSSGGDAGNAATSGGGSDAGIGNDSGASSAGDGATTGSGGQDASSGMDGSPGASTPQKLILYDDSNGRLLYIDNANPAANWIASTGMGRDLQLVGGGRVMLGKFDGWDEYQLSDGTKVGAGQHGFPGTLDSYRLTDGNTVLASLAGGAIVLKMVSAAGQVQRQVTYPGFSFVGMVRPTSAGTYLVGADTVVFEGDDQGKIVSRLTPAGARHAWKAMRLANGNTVISTGYGASLVIYDSTGKLVQTIGGPNQPSAAQIAPWFYADFHLLSNGRYFVVNSQADRTMNSSVQLLEYDAAGTLVWQQKQPMSVRTFEEGIVLDGLDTSKLNVEPQGTLVPYP